MYVIKISNEDTQTIVVIVLHCKLWSTFIYVVLCAIQYHVHNLKNMKNTNGGLLLLVKLQANACNFTKSNTPPWVFFTFFKLYEWYEIAQSTAYDIKPYEKKGKWNKLCKFGYAQVPFQYRWNLLNYWTNY